jgi:glycine dehydrogenase subunit 2
MSIIFDRSVKGRKGYTLPDSKMSLDLDIPENLKRSEDANLPELSELDVARHFTELSRLNFGVDTNFYPLGSCTMKYNPKIAEKVASLDGFAELHPLLPQLRGGGMLTQGALRVIYDLEQKLQEICGMDAFTLQPMAGAHGELTAMMMIAAYHKKNGNTHKNEVLIPDEAHGTNPSSAAIAGFKTRSVPTNPETGMIDVDALKELVNDNTAALMLTNPNTLGIFNSRINEVADIVHSVDAQLYYDGANLNAVLGKFRPGDANFDAVHLNLHKTFATPHGGGGPGAGPVGVKEHLKEFLPISRVEKRNDGTLALSYDHPNSIGYVAPFYGNFGVCLRAYSYILTLGKEGLERVSENAVLNANYIMNSLKDIFELPHDRVCMHEVVFSASRQLKESGVSALDIAKGLIDRGIHPPTIYFPLIVKEAMMVEPTETESKETIDHFISVMREIAETAKSNPEQLHLAPITTPVSRMDEVKAAKEMVVIHPE